MVGFSNDREPVTIQISKYLVIRKDTTFVTNILDSFIPDEISCNINRVQIEVLGYGEDPRELFDIPEVRTYFQALFDQIDGAFYWIDTNSYMFLFWGLMLLNPYRCDGKVGLLPEDMQKYLTWGFIKLNAFCLKHGLSPEVSTKAINDAVQAFVD